MGRLVWICVNVGTLANDVNYQVLAARVGYRCSIPFATLVLVFFYGDFHATWEAHPAQRGLILLFSAAKPG